MKTKIFLFLSLTLFAAEISAQMAMGSWRTHLAYNQITQIAQSDEKVYAVSDGALFSVNKFDESTEVYSKISGLSDNNITQINFAVNNNLLFIAYENSNIDLLTNDGEIFNITDIYKKNINGSKRINNITFIGEKAYLSCDFGIVAVNLQRREITDTYFLGPDASMIKTLAMVELDGKFYATTENLFLAANKNSNLLNYQNWKQITPSRPINYKYSAVYNGEIYIHDTNGKVHTYNDTEGWKLDIMSDVERISVSNGVLFVAYKNKIDCYNSNATPVELSVLHAEMGLFDTVNRTYWIAARENGMVKCRLDDGTFNAYKTSGPAVNYAWRMKHSNGKIIVVPGGRWATQYNRDGYVMMYENGEWTNIYTNDFAATGLPTWDFVDVAIDPRDNSHFFVASYGIGLFEFRNNKFYKLHNNDNSNIETIFPDKKGIDNNAYYYYHRVDGLIFDKDNNLWLLNMERPSIIKYMTPYTETSDGIVKSVPYPEIKTAGTAQDILISNKNANHKWVCIPRIDGGTGIFTFDDNGTLDNTDDDVRRLFRSFNDQDQNKFQPEHFFCIAQDKDGDIWLGSDKGPIVLENSEACFNENFGCTRIKIPRNDGTNLADYLLESERINAIAIDGANRKWIGTETSGVYLLSPNGLTTIHHFTTENSPLLSNTILSIVINDKTGEVFFGTGNGIISFQSDAREGGETFENVHAFPNPVRENYHGLISITGLIENSIVKITDLNGHTIFETVSNGGIATWDGTRKGGERVATGIYVVICLSKDGKQHATTKILFIN